MLVMHIHTTRQNTHTHKNKNKSLILRFKNYSSVLLFVVVSFKNKWSPKKQAHSSVLLRHTADTKQRYVPPTSDSHNNGLFFFNESREYSGVCLALNSSSRARKIAHRANDFLHKHEDLSPHRQCGAHFQPSAHQVRYKADRKSSRSLQSAR